MPTLKGPFTPKPLNTVFDEEDKNGRRWRQRLKGYVLVIDMTNMPSGDGSAPISAGLTVRLRQQLLPYLNRYNAHYIGTSMRRTGYNQGSVPNLVALFHSCTRAVRAAWCVGEAIHGYNTTVTRQTETEKYSRTKAAEEIEKKRKANKQLLKELDKRAKQQARHKSRQRKNSGDATSSESDDDDNDDSSDDDQMEVLFPPDFRLPLTMGVGIAFADEDDDDDEALHIDSDGSLVGRAISEATTMAEAASARIDKSKSSKDAKAKRRRTRLPKSKRPEQKKSHSRVVISRLIMNDIETDARFKKAYFRAIKVPDTIHRATSDHLGRPLDVVAVDKSGNGGGGLFGGGGWFFRNDDHYFVVGDVTVSTFLFAASTSDEFVKGDAVQDLAALAAPETSEETRDELIGRIRAEHTRTCTILVFRVADVVPDPADAVELSPLMGRGGSIKTLQGDGSALSGDALPDSNGQFAFPGSSSSSSSSKSPSNRVRILPPLSKKSSVRRSPGSLSPARSLRKQLAATRESLKFDGQEQKQFDMDSNAKAARHLALARELIEVTAISSNRSGQRLGLCGDTWCFAKPEDALCAAAELSRRVNITEDGGFLHRHGLDGTTRIWCGVAQGDVVVIPGHDLCIGRPLVEAWGLACPAPPPPSPGWCMPKPPGSSDSEGSGSGSGSGSEEDEPEDEDGGGREGRTEESEEDEEGLPDDSEHLYVHVSARLYEETLRDSVQLKALREAMDHDELLAGGGRVLGLGLGGETDGDDENGSVASGIKDENGEDLDDEELRKRRHPNAMLGFQPGTEYEYRTKAVSASAANDEGSRSAATSPVPGGDGGGGDGVVSGSHLSPEAAAAAAGVDGTESTGRNLASPLGMINAGGRESPNSGVGMGAYLDKVTHTRRRRSASPVPLRVEWWRVVDLPEDPVMEDDNESLQEQRERRAAAREIKAITSEAALKNPNHPFWGRVRRLFRYIEKKVHEGKPGNEPVDAEDVGVGVGGGGAGGGGEEKADKHHHHRKRKHAHTHVLTMDDLLEFFADAGETYAEGTAAYYIDQMDGFSDNRTDGKVTYQEFVEYFCHLANDQGVKGAEEALTELETFEGYEYGREWTAIARQLRTLHRAIDKMVKNAGLSLAAHQKPRLVIPKCVREIPDQKVRKRMIKMLQIGHKETTRASRGSDRRMAHAENPNSAHIVLNPHGRLDLHATMATMAARTPQPSAFFLSTTNRHDVYTHAAPFPKSRKFPGADARRREMVEQEKDWRSRLPEARYDPSVPHRVPRPLTPESAAVQAARNCRGILNAAEREAEALVAAAGLGPSVLHRLRLPRELLDHPRLVRPGDEMEFLPAANAESSTAMVAAPSAFSPAGMAGGPGMRSRSSSSSSTNQNLLKLVHPKRARRARTNTGMGAYSPKRGRGATLTRRGASKRKVGAGTGTGPVKIKTTPRTRQSRREVTVKKLKELKYPGKISEIDPSTFAPTFFGGFSKHLTKETAAISAEIASIKTFDQMSRKERMIAMAKQEEEEKARQHDAEIIGGVPGLSGSRASYLAASRPL